MEIVVISNNYPSYQIPNKGAFVYNLVQELCKYHNVTVISPFKISDLFRKKSFYGPERAVVYRPLYPSIGSKKYGKINLEKLSFAFLKWAVNHCFSTKIEQIDVIYTHFLINALTIDKTARKKNIPLVIASGESTYRPIAFFNKTRILELFNNAKLVITVAKANSDSLKKMGLAEEKVQVVPNAVDYALFKPMDRYQCKEKLNINKSTFVVGFIGHFIKRKGPNRLIQAIKLLNDKNIKLVCIGSGESLIEAEFVKIIPPVANVQLPEIINAFDIFVLPTLAEGHCNVIEEVKACCIPIVSSKGTTVENQIDEKSGILIDPTDINDIAAAINELKCDSSKRNDMTLYLEGLRGLNSLEKRMKTIEGLLSKVIK